MGLTAPTWLDLKHTTLTPAPQALDSYTLSVIWLIQNTLLPYVLYFFTGFPSTHGNPPSPCIWPVFPRVGGPYFLLVQLPLH